MPEGDKWKRRKHYSNEVKEVPEKVLVPLKSELEGREPLKSRFPVRVDG